MWEDIHEAVDKALISDVIGEILSSLSDRHRTVLVCRFWHEMTLKETAKKCNVSTERIRQGEAKALRILRSEKYLKEFDKLGLDWVQRIREDRQKQERLENERRFKEEAEYHRRCVEKRIEEQNLKRARQKLKIIDSEIPKPEAIVISYKYKPPYFPPHFVKVMYNSNNEHYLYVEGNYGSIDRRLDPETYDRWLEYLVSKDTLKPQSH